MGVVYKALDGQKQSGMTEQGAPTGHAASYVTRSNSIARIGRLPQRALCIGRRRMLPAYWQSCF